jgi:hypothetical protein
MNRLSCRVHAVQVYALLLASRKHCDEVQRLGAFIEQQQVARRYPRPGLSKRDGIHGRSEAFA